MRLLRKLLRLYNGFILPVVLVSASAGIIFRGIVPGVKTIQNLYIENDKLGKEVAQIKKKVDTLESIDLVTLESYLTSLISAVPQEKSYPTFLLGLEGVAQQTSVALNEFEVESPGSIASESSQKISQTAGQNIISAEIGIAGKMDQLKNFFDTLIRVRRLMAVTAFSMNFPEDAEVIVTDLSVRAFYAPLPKTLGKPSDVLEPFSEKDSELLAKISAYPSAMDAAPASFGNPGEIREDPFSL